MYVCVYKTESERWNKGERERVQERGGAQMGDFLLGIDVLALQWSSNRITYE